MELLKSGARELGIDLNDRQIEQFDLYSREIIDWNRKVNLTAIIDYQEIQIRHFLDSLSIAPSLNSVSGEEISVLDIGTGAGLPGIPLKLVLPHIKLTLLEATAKKTEFLTYIVSTLGLTDTSILTSRAEEAARTGKYRERFSVVTARAVAPVAVLAELALPFCIVGGYCIFPKKGDMAKEMNDATNAIELCGGKLREIQPVTIGGLDDNRQLVIIDKVSPTPDKYPRRPGIPEKRPIK